MKGPVWLIDDMEFALDIIKLFLQKEGYTTVVYSCPLKALHDLEQGQVPWLIVTDFCMPSMNGIEFIDAVHSTHKGIPAIIITGDPDSINKKNLRFPVIEKGKTTFMKDLLKMVHSFDSYVFQEMETEIDQGASAKTSFTPLSVPVKKKTLFSKK